MASINSPPFETLQQIMILAVPEVYFVRIPNSEGVRRPDAPLINLLLVSRSFSAVVRSVVPRSLVLNLGLGNPLWQVTSIVPDRPVLDLGLSTSVAQVERIVPQHILDATVTIIGRVDLLRLIRPPTRIMSNLQEAHISVRGGWIEVAALLPTNANDEFDANLRPRLYDRLYRIVPWYQRVFQSRNPTSFLIHANLMRRTGLNTHEDWVITHTVCIDTKTRSPLTLS